MQTANAQLDTSPAPCNNKPSYKGRMWMLRHPWYIRHIGDCGMKQISVFDFYVLGRALAAIRAWNKDTLRSSVTWEVTVAHEQLTQATRADSILLPSTIAAARQVIARLEENFKIEVECGGWDGPEAATLTYRAAFVDQAVQAFESVFKMDSAQMMVFHPGQKGIYHTGDLIERASDHIPTSLAKLLPVQAKTDIDAAGRCLAFDVPTGSAFHMWRALETTFGELFFALQSKTFAQAGVSRNWYKYIEALTKAGVDVKITGNLDHIREHYRNPCMHPNENATQEEAFGLFGVGISAITQVLQVIAALQPKP